MSPHPCPNCHVLLPFKDLEEGWCDACGKQIPQWLQSAALKEAHADRKHVREAALAPTFDDDRPVVGPVRAPVPAKLGGPPRNWPVSAVGVVNLVLGGLCVFWGVYLLVAGAELLGAMFQGGGEARQAAEGTTAAVDSILWGVVVLMAALLFLQAVPLLLAGWGVLTRRNWGRLLALVLAVLLGLQGLSCLPSAREHGGYLAAGVFLIVYAVLAFVVLLSRPAAVEFRRRPAVPV